MCTIYTTWRKCAAGSLWSSLQLSPLCADVAGRLSFWATRPNRATTSDLIASRSFKIWWASREDSNPVSARTVCPLMRPVSIDPIQMDRLRTVSTSSRFWWRPWLPTGFWLQIAATKKDALLKVCEMLFQFEHIGWTAIECPISEWKCNETSFSSV